MKGISCYRYIHLGLCLRLLRHANLKNNKKFIKDHLEKVKNGLENSSLEVSLSYTESDGYYDLEESINKLESDSTEIGPEILKNLSNELNYLEKVVFAEATTKKVYIIPQRRFNSSYLLSQPEKLLKEGMFEKLSDIAKSDISSAGRCLLFGESTASAFHILRATEEILKSYYFHHRKTKRLQKPMWGPMLNQLRAKKQNKPPVVLLNSLDLIREAYRNPTQHPSAIYEIDSAQDLFGVCLDSIGKMASELN